MHCLLFFLVLLSLGKSSPTTGNTTESDKNQTNTYKNNTYNNTNRPESTADSTSHNEKTILTSSSKTDLTTEPTSCQDYSESDFMFMNLKNKKEMLLWCIIFFLALVCFLKLIIILTLICRRNNVVTTTAQRTAQQINPNTFESFDGEPFETVVMTNYTQQEPENETEMVTPQEVENTPEVEKAEDAIPTTLEVNGNPVSDAGSLPEPEPSEQTGLMDEEGIPS